MLDFMDKICGSLRSWDQNCSAESLVHEEYQTSITGYVLSRLAKVGGEIKRQTDMSLDDNPHHGLLRKGSNSFKLKKILKLTALSLATFTTAVILSTAEATGRLALAVISSPLLLTAFVGRKEEAKIPLALAFSACVALGNVTNAVVIPFEFIGHEDEVFYDEWIASSECNLMTVIMNCSEAVRYCFNRMLPTMTPRVKFKIDSDNTPENCFKEIIGQKLIGLHAIFNFSTYFPGRQDIWNSDKMYDFARKYDSAKK